MSKEVSFVIKKRKGTSGNRSCHYDYLLNGKSIAKGLRRVNLDFLPMEIPTVTLEICPKRIDIDADFLAEMMQAEHSE